ncbi:MAG: hypothetical protein ACI9E1_002106, partial [Cryomorphaceae bacterium]
EPQLLRPSIIKAMGNDLMMFMIVILIRKFIE